MSPARYGGLSRTIALGAFGLRSNLGSRLVLPGLCLATGIVLLGPALSLTRGEGWVADGELTFFGYFLALLLLVRSGLEDQRESGLGELLVPGLTSRVDYAVGLILSLLGSAAVLSTWSFAAMVLAGAAPADALWTLAHWGLRVLVLTGWVLWVERFATLRLPALLPALAYLGVLVLLTLTVGEERAYHLFVVARQDDPGTLLPLLGQAVFSFLLATGPLVAIAAWRDRPRPLA